MHREQAVMVTYGFDERAKWATEEKAQTLSVGGGGMVQFSYDLSANSRND